MLQWLSRDVTEALAFITCSDIGLGVLLHSRPVVSSSHELLNKGVGLCLITTNPLMYFFHYIIFFVRG